MEDSLTRQMNEYGEFYQMSSAMVIFFRWGRSSKWGNNKVGKNDSTVKVSREVKFPAQLHSIGPTEHSDLDFPIL